jgi:hypothetical protein
MAKMSKEERELQRRRDEVARGIVLNGDGTASWVLERVGRDGQLYSGTFRFRCELSPIQIIRTDRDQRRLLGEHATYASDIAFNLAASLAQLKHAVVECPPFWSEGGDEFPGSQVKDLSIVSIVSEAATLAVEKYAKHLAEEADRKAERIRKHLSDMAEQAKKRDDEEEGE